MLLNLFEKRKSIMFPAGMLTFWHFLRAYTTEAKKGTIYCENKQTTIKSLFYLVHALSRESLNG